MTEHDANNQHLNIDDILPVLNKISIFAGLTDQQLYTLFFHLKEVVYTEGQAVFKQGDRPGEIYVVLTGRIRLVADQDETVLELFEFGPGHCFGETAVIGIVPHEAGAVVMERSKLLILSRQTLMTFLKTDLELFSVLILNIAREACRRLHRTDQILLHYVRHA